MHRLSLLGAIHALLLSVALSQAADLKQIDRGIAAEPAYQSPPKYCLLAFGPDAEHRVWLVHDGDTLYVDRNGNGNLTEPDERVKANDDDRYAVTFDVGDLSIGNRTHKRFRVDVKKFARLAERDPQAKKRVAEDPDARHYRLQLDLDLPGRFGRGIGGRVEHDVERDASGLLEFADTAENSPIVHFEGLWEITLLEKPRLAVGRSTELLLGIGSPGLGVGATAFAAYEGVVPDGLLPEAIITYPAAAPIRQPQKVKERCCTICLHDSITVPETAGAGPATVALSFDTWKDEIVAPSRHVVDVLPSPRGPKPEPVSKQLKRTLVHPSRSGLIPVIAWSPDGRRIAARERESGLIQIWDAHSGKELVKIETGQRDNSPEFVVTRDWGTLFVARQETVDRVRVERDGKKLFRWQYAGDIRAWDLSTGELKRTFKHDPPRGEFLADVAPDGSTFATFEWLSGEWEEEPPRAASVWDARTGEVRDLGTCIPRVYSPDGRTLVGQTENERRQIDSIMLLEMPSAREIISIPIREKDARSVVTIAFTPDGKRLVGEVQDQTKTGQHWLKFWDPATGREVASVTGEPRDFWLWMVFSADSRFLAVRNVGRPPRPNQLSLFDVPTGSLVKTISLPTDFTVWRHFFSPDGKWLAAAVQTLPENIRLLRSSPEDFAQPRILLIEVATGEVRETIISPRAFPEAISFSPDGHTLATSGDGCVLLWDLEAVGSK